jgi:hypothetical protein
VLQSTPAIQPAPAPSPTSTSPHNLLAQLALLCSPLASACRPQLHPSLHTRIPPTLHLHKHFLPAAEVALFLVTPQSALASNCRSTCAATDPDTLTCGITYGEAHHSHPACHTNITHSRPWLTHRVKAHHETNYFLIYFLLSAAATQFLSYHRQLPDGHDGSQQFQVHPACQNTTLISSPGSLKDPQPPRFPPRTLSPRFFRLLLRLKTRLQALRAPPPRSAPTQRLSPPPTNLISILPRHLTTRDQILLPPGSRAPGGRMTGVLEL